MTQFCITIIYVKNLLKICNRFAEINNIHLNNWKKIKLFQYHEQTNIVQFGLNWPKIVVKTYANFILCF